MLMPTAVGGSYACVVDSRVLYDIYAGVAVTSLTFSQKLSKESSRLE